MTRRLFASMVRRIELLPLPAGVDELPQRLTSAGTAEGEGRVSDGGIGQERVRFGPRQAQGSQTNVFGGAFTARPSLRLRLDRSSGTLSVGPEVQNGNSGPNEKHRCGAATEGGAT
jgi:hypothetical protein